eukprot:scaffold250987_cov32-Tisochrysis_lutea.AAC.1
MGFHAARRSWAVSVDGTRSKRLDDHRSQHGPDLADHRWAICVKQEVVVEVVGAVDAAQR